MSPPNEAMAMKSNLSSPRRPKISAKSPNLKALSPRSSTKSPIHVKASPRSSSNTKSTTLKSTVSRQSKVINNYNDDEARKEEQIRSLKEELRNDTTSSPKAGRQNTKSPTLKTKASPRSSAKTANLINDTTRSKSTKLHVNYDRRNEKTENYEKMANNQRDEIESSSNTNISENLSNDTTKSKPKVDFDESNEKMESNHINNDQKIVRNQKDEIESTLLHFAFREKLVPVTYNSTISNDIIKLAIASNMFQRWIENTSRVFGSKSIELYGVEIESVHMIGGRVDCINMKVESDLTDEDEAIQDERIKEFCCLRDHTVGILVELHCLEDDTIWTVLVDQPRLNVGAVSALELPVGLVDEDGDSLIGTEAKEVESICHLSLKQSELINLTQRAYENSCVFNSTGLCPSLSNCSEFIKIMYSRKEITKSELKVMRKRLSQTREEGAAMSLRVVPLEDMWKVSADMKVVWYVVYILRLFIRYLLILFYD